MAVIRRLTLSTAAAASAILAVATLAAAPAVADSGGHGDTVVDAALLGSTPAPVSPVIAGVNPGGAPWVNGPSSARVRERGRTEVMIQGLIIPALGRNPIPSVVATLVCDNMVAGSTAPFDLSAAGNGQTRDRIAVPHDCDNGQVLIQPAANRAVYIASTVAGEDDD